MATNSQDSENGKEKEHAITCNNNKEENSSIEASTKSEVDSLSRTVFASALFPTVPWSMPFRNLSGSSSANSSRSSPSTSLLASESAASKSLVKSSCASTTISTSLDLSSLPKDISTSKQYQSVKELCNRLRAGTKQVYPSTSINLSEPPYNSSSSLCKSLSKSKKSTSKTTVSGISMDSLGERSSTFSEIQQSDTNEPLNLVTKGTKDASDYKASHPIGSRKATENVITYHEPIFQSVANSIFENKKNVMVAKRKMEEKIKSDKNEPGTPENKKPKLLATSPISDPKLNKRKKFSIENIIERIRTEKTVSKGNTNAGSGGSSSVNTSTDAQQEVKTPEASTVQYKDNVKTVSDNVKIEVSAPNELNKADESTGNVVCKKESLDSNSDKACSRCQNEESDLNNGKITSNSNCKKESSISNNRKATSNKTETVQNYDEINVGSKKGSTKFHKIGTGPSEEKSNLVDSRKSNVNEKDYKIPLDNGRTNSKYLENKKKAIALKEDITGEKKDKCVQNETFKPVKKETKQTDEKNNTTDLVSKAENPTGQRDSSMTKIIKKSYSGCKETKTEKAVAKKSKVKLEESNQRTNKANTKKDKAKLDESKEGAEKAVTKKTKVKTVENEKVYTKKTKAKLEESNVAIKSNTKKTKAILMDSKKDLKKTDSKTSNAKSKEKANNSEITCSKIKKNDQKKEEAKVIKKSTKKETGTRKAQGKTNKGNKIGKDSNVKQELNTSAKGIQAKRKHSELDQDDNINEPKCKKEKTVKENEDDKKNQKCKKACKTAVKKTKLPIACSRIKREASLNAATLVNILCESPRTSKLGDKRSKSDSDLKFCSSPPTLHPVSVSVSNLDLVDEIGSVNLTEKFLSKINSTSPSKVNSGSSISDGRKRSLTSSGDKTNSLISDGSENKSQKAIKSPTVKRKVSFTDESFDSVFEAVIQRSIVETKGPSVEKKLKVKEMKKENNVIPVKKHEVVNKANKACDTKKIKGCKVLEQMDKKIKKVIKLTVSKSPDEIAEKKRKANLARLQRAKELLKTKKRVSDEFSSDDINASDSESVSTNSVSDDIESEVTVESDKSSEIWRKYRAKKGSMFRAARTHVSVESRTVVENAMPSPRWCECCQSTYYPNQPSQGTQVWRIKHLVDKGSSKSPEPIQTSSHHFISAHASCEVRPYASPSHVSVIESTPYMGQIMPHGHIQCSACTCSHSGMFHTTSCQNCTLSGVGNMMSCQRYGNPYSVTYPHSHGSYTHCGCGRCYSTGTYLGQTLIHQPQMSMSPESTILLHHSVPLQVTHETTLPVSLPTLTHSHSDPKTITHTFQKQLTHTTEQTHSNKSLKLSQGDQEQFTRMCQWSQGEVTNVSVLASNSQSDLEIVDIESRDDITKPVSNYSSQAPLSSISSSGLENLSNYTKTKLSCAKVTVIKKSKKLKASEEIDKQITKLQKEAREKSKVSEKKNLTLQLLENKKRGRGVKKSEAKQTSATKNKRKHTTVSKIFCSTKSNTDSSDKAKKKRKDPNMESKSMKQTREKNVQPESGKNRMKSFKENEGIKEGKAMLKEKVGDQGDYVKAWSWDGEGTLKKCINIFNGQQVDRKCYNGIIHRDGDKIRVKDCVLVCSGTKEKDIPYVAKVTSFWEEIPSGEMMMSVLWFYRPEHAEGARLTDHLENEVFAAKHKDETLVACIEDKGYVLTYNEYCRFTAEVERVKSNLPHRKKVVPDLEDAYPNHRIPPVDVDPENVFLCRQVYDIKLKRVLKNPS